MLNIPFPTSFEFDGDKALDCCSQLILIARASLMLLVELQQIESTFSRRSLDKNVKIWQAKCPRSSLESGFSGDIQEGRQSLLSASTCIEMVRILEKHEASLSSML